VGNWWNLNAAILRELQGESESRHVPMLFVRLPTLAQSNGRVPVKFPVLDAFMRDLDANYLDLSLQHPPLAEILYPKNGHLNPAGHGFVAQEIGKWMEKHPPS